MATRQKSRSDSRDASASPSRNLGHGVEQTGEERFNEAYQQALLRKRLFKEYLSRHQVLERFNVALEQLFECDQLPEDPVPYLLDQMKAKPAKRATARPTSASFKSGR